MLWLAGWMGMVAGAATDPLVAVYAVIGAALVRSLRQATIYAILGGVALSLLISWITLATAQMVVPGISFADWAGRMLLARVGAVAIIVFVGLGVRRLVARKGQPAGPFQSRLSDPMSVGSAQMKGLAIGHLYEDEDLLLMNARVDGLIARDKRSGTTIAATRSQAEQLENVVKCLEEVAAVGGRVGGSDAAILGYGLFAAAITRPEHERSREFLGATPQLIAEKLMAAIEAGERRRRGVPPQEIEKISFSQSRGPNFNHPYERVSYLVLLVSSAFFFGSSFILIGVPILFDGYDVSDALRNIFFRDYLPSSVRSFKWLREPFMASPFVAIAAWIAAFRNAGIKRLWRWIVTGN